MKIGWKRGLGGDRRSLPYLVLLLSLATTVCAWIWAGDIVRSKDSERFAFAAKEAEHAIHDRLDDQVDVLRASAATFALQEGWTLSQFRAYVAHLGLSANFQGSQGIGFIQRTAGPDVAALERRIRLEGDPSFSVFPASNDPVRYPVVYLEPSSGANARSIGYDAFTDPVRRQAIVKATDSGQPTLSGVIYGEGRRSGQGGFILYCPIYRGGQTPTRPEDRQVSLIGFVYSRCRGNDLFRGVLEGEARHDVDIEIFDGSGQTPMRLYTSSRSAMRRHAKISTDQLVPILGRTWLVRYHSSASFEQQSAGWLVNWILIAGIMVSFVLAAVSFTQVRAYGVLDSQAAALARREAALEHMVDERTTELQATNHELEAFCYSVSHDLRAPLRSVDGFSKTLLEDYRDQLDDRARDYIGRVRKASHRMDELITALLNLSRITRQEIVRQQVDISQTARNTVDDALEGRDRSQFQITVQPGMVAEADPKLIRVVFDNLVRNAVKFSGPKKLSKIEIGLNGSAFFVRDNGVGFNPAYSDKLFVAFERLHSQSEFPGSGIGLATVQRIVQKHGGKVWAESEEGKGATFSFTLR